MTPAVLCAQCGRIAALVTAKAYGPRSPDFIFRPAKDKP